VYPTAVHRQVWRSFFKELNHVILYGEIIGTLLIGIFAALVLINQWKRMGEKEETTIENNR
jgi:hypothetical protein